MLEIDRAREETRAATAAASKEIARRQAVELQASEAALAAQALKTSLEREIATGALVTARHLSELAMTRAALEAMTARMTDRDSALAREADAHEATKSLLERAISAVENRPQRGAAPGPAAKAAKTRRGGN